MKNVLLKTIPNKLNLDLKRANNHNLATLAELQKVLKLIEEADKSEQQDRSKLKQKPRFDRNKNDSRGRNNP